MSDLRARLLRLRARGEQGVVSLEAAIAAPLVIAATLLAIQVGFYALNRNTVVNTAQVAVEAARADGGSVSAGHSAAQAYLAQVHGPSATSISVARGAETATATVSAPFPQMVPFLKLAPIKVTVNAPVERLTEPQ